MNMKVLIPIADGSEEIESVTVIDILRRAGV
ncbi:MAG: DJ-1 family protein, partial [Porticoccaceae bacterium]|nr:DJ-1 family protein [Porticoccaceae bacterium]